MAIIELNVSDTLEALIKKCNYNFSNAIKNSTQSPIGYAVTDNGVTLYPEDNIITPAIGTKYTTEEANNIFEWLQQCTLDTIATGSVFKYDNVETGYIIDFRITIGTMDNYEVIDPDGDSITCAEYDGIYFIYDNNDDSIYWEPNYVLNPADESYVPITIEVGNTSITLDGNKIFIISPNGIDGIDSFDPTPIANSVNAVTSGGVYDAIQNNSIIVDHQIINGSMNPVDGNSVYDALQDKANTTYVNTQLNNKADVNHDHSASDITNGVFSLDRIPSAIGAYHMANASGNSFNVQNATYTDLVSLLLEAGTWIIMGTVEFSVNTTGRRVVALNTTPGGAGINLQARSSSAPVTGGATRTKFFMIVQPTQNTRYYATAWQNSGGILTCYAYMQAVRIR